MLTPIPDQLDPSIEAMDRVWQAIASTTASYRRDVGNLPVAPRIRLEELRESINSMQCVNQMDWQDVFQWLDRHMRDDQLHVSHPRYFGLFNPAPFADGYRR